MRVLEKLSKSIVDYSIKVTVIRETRVTEEAK